MARSHGAMTSPGRPGQRRPAAEHDPRNGRPQAPAPRYPQAPQNPGYPPAAYPDPQNPGYDPQSAYHYPQQTPQYPQAAPGRPVTRQANPDPITQPGPADYGSFPTTQPPFGHGQQAHPQQRNFGPIPAAAPQFPGPSEPRTVPPSYDQWGAPAPHQDPRGYDLGTYMPNGQPDLGAHRGAPGQGAFAPDPLQQQAEWVHAAQVPYGDAGMPEHQLYPGNQLGYDQPHHPGALEANHNHDEAGEYEYDEPRRGSWVLRIAGAIVVAVGLGYGLAQGYKMLLGSPSDATTPVVKGESEPVKTMPTDPGGKQFAHADSKVMGRLGDGAPASDETGSATPADTDTSGTRKVQTVVVGRDGAIVPPSAPAESAPPAESASPPGQSVAVPGLTVIDGFGGRYPSNNNVTTAAVPPQKSTASKSVVVNPPAKHAKAKAAAPPPPPAAEADAATFDETSAPAAKAPAAAKKQVAAADPSASSTGANGYVVVLASIPASGNSRLDALKRFADMQQKYGTVLANKTPEVQEANLGDKGMFNRLLVGPPGSRSQASQLCTELKASGYKDCWVTAY
jgi:hypothetical protein